MSRKDRYNPIKEGYYELIKNIRRNSKLQSIWENEVYMSLNEVIIEYPSNVKITKITNKDKTLLTEIKPLLDIKYM